MTYRVLVPVKALSEAKSRLAAHLTSHERKTVMLDMLRHVLLVLRESPQLAAITVVSPDPQVLALARTWGVQALAEEAQGHNPALHAAALRELDAGATALLTISADLPLLTAADIHALIEQSRRFPVVLAPSRDGTGTNAILMRPPLVLPYLFGPNSLQRYTQAAAERGLSSTRYESIGVALDIDTIDDLHHAQNYTPLNTTRNATCSQCPERQATG